MDFRQIAAAEAEAEDEIIKAIEKEFEAIETPSTSADVAQSMANTIAADDIVEDPSEKLHRLNLMFDNEQNVS